MRFDKKKRNKKHYDFKFSIGYKKGVENPSFFFWYFIFKGSKLKVVDVWGGLILFFRC